MGANATLLKWTQGQFKVVIVEDPFESEDGIQSAVVWPAGASWCVDPPAVELQGQLFEPGMIVEGAGGAFQHEQVEEVAGTAVADAAQACAGPAGEVAFFNLGSEVSDHTD